MTELFAVTGTMPRFEAYFGQIRFLENYFMHKKISALLAILFSLVYASLAQEIKGKWAGTFEADDVFAAIRLDFDEKKIVLSFGGSERPGTIKNLRSENGEIAFDAELRPAARFSGRINADKISGIFEILRSDGTKQGAGIWEARKVDSLDFKDDLKPSAINEKVELPAPSGKYPIGRKFFYWTDESRAEIITDNANDKRKLFVQLWYPAKKGGKQTAEYYPNLVEILGKNERNELLSAIKTHAFQDAKLAESKMKFPVIIFSPGLGSSPFSYATIIENLVSRGYVIAAINHPYDSGDFKFSDGEIIRFADEKWNREAPKDWTADERKRFFDERRIGWAHDISFVASQLENLEKPFKEKLDLQKLGALGHSFGGQAATIACASDARFKACANLDGMAQGSVFLPDASGKVIRQPFLFFSKAAEVTDTELKMMNITREEYRRRDRKRLVERWKPSFKNRLAEIESGAYFALYPGVKHSSFSDSLVLFTEPNDPLYPERKIAAGIINEYILAFFDKFLLKKPSPLFDDPNERRPPVILEFLKQNK